jgi:hypothetical protein
MAGFAETKGERHNVRRIQGAIDTTLTPPEPQYGAMLGNPEQRKPPWNAVFAMLGNPLQRVTDHS